MRRRFSVRHQGNVRNSRPEEHPCRTVCTLHTSPIRGGPLRDGDLCTVAAGRASRADLRLGGREHGALDDLVRTFGCWESGPARRRPHWCDRDASGEGNFRAIPWLHDPWTALPCGSPPGAQADVSQASQPGNRKPMNGRPSFAKREREMKLKDRARAKAERRAARRAEPRSDSGPPIAADIATDIGSGTTSQPVASGPDASSLSATSPAGPDRSP